MDALRVTFCLAVVLGVALNGCDAGETRSESRGQASVTSGGSTTVTIGGRSTGGVAKTTTKFTAKNKPGSSSVDASVESTSTTSLSKKCSCEDVTPVSAKRWTCADQKMFKKCEKSWMKNGGYCACTCGHCPEPKCKCDDTQPPGGFSCEQQKKWGKCGESWIKGAGHCKCTCGYCNQ